MTFPGAQESARENTMKMRKYRVGQKRLWRRSRMAQTALIMAFWGLGEALVRLAHLPLPGGIPGLFAVLVLLVSGRMQARQLRRGASLLLAEMLLFFIPAVLVVLDHKELLGLTGLKVLGAILTGTLVVMAGTALIVDLCFRMANHERA